MSISNDDNSIMIEENNISIKSEMEGISNDDDEKMDEGNNDKYDTGWNDTIELYMRNIRDNCKIYKDIHFKKASTTHRRHAILMVCNMILGPLGGMLTIIHEKLGTHIYQDDDRNNNNIDGSGGSDTNPSWKQILAITVTVTGFISGFFAAITKYAAYEQKSVNHKTAASRYNSLEMNINRQLSIDTKLRIHSSKYMLWVGNSYDDLFISSPLIDIPDNVSLHSTDITTIDTPPTLYKHKPSTDNIPTSSLHIYDNNFFSDNYMNYEIDKFTGKF